MFHAALRSGRPLASAASLRPTAPALPFATVEAHADPRAALDAWRVLFAAAPASPYQSPDWMLPWIATVGAAGGIRPLIVVARDADGRPQALLPLGLCRHRGVVEAGFLGGKDSNFNMGLFRPGPAWSADALRTLLRRAATAARVDVFAFRNQPLGWADTPNPMTALPSQQSPSFAYKAALTRDPDAFLRAHLSRDTRKKVRQKLNRLRALGDVSLVEADAGAATAELLGAFVAQRRARNLASGLSDDDLATLLSFLDQTAGRDGPVLFYGLRCGGRIVATLGGTWHGGRFCGMLTSFDATPEVARASPGELLLSEVMKRHCAIGTAVFDLGIGEARYKESYCPEVEPLFDSLVAITTRGRLFAKAEATRLRVKRSIKQSRWAWPLTQRLRQLRPRRIERPW